MAKSSAAAERAVSGFEEIPLAQISESPFNPRKTFDEEQLQELAEDVKLRGVLQPVLVRPMGNGYELVFGARRFRAAKLAKLASIPARIAIMTEGEALETAIIENSKRSDVHPLEEADGYRELRDKHGFTAEEIAEKVGKSLAWVYGRLKLCALDADARDAFASGDLPASHALLLARITDPKRQAEALTRLQWGEGFCPYRRAEEIIQNEFMRQLKGAPFDPADEDLVPAAGSCKACPKRLGNMGEGKGRADVCTDLACYTEKLQALAKRKQADAEKTGLKVLRGSEAEAALRWGSPFAKASEKVYLDVEPKEGDDEDAGIQDRESTWKELLVEKGVDPKPVALAITATGDVVELLDKKEVLAPLVRQGDEWAKSEMRYVRDEAGTGDSGDSYRQQQAKRNREARRRAQVVRLAMPEILDAITTASLGSSKLWNLFAQLALKHAGADGRKAAASRRDIKVKDGLSGYSAEPAIKKELARGVTQEGLAGWALELLIAGDASGGMWNSGYGQGFQLAAKFAGVDLKRLSNQVVAEEKAKAKGKKKPKGAGK